MHGSTETTRERRTDTTTQQSTDSPPDDSEDLEPYCRAKHRDSKWLPEDPEGTVTEFYDPCGWCFADRELDDVNQLLRSSTQHGRHLHRPAKDSDGEAESSPDPAINQERSP
jgi:hypothetical protein